MLKILWFVPLFTLITPLAGLAKDSASILPMALGRDYTGSLRPSPSNPHGEICYQLAVKPNTRITLNVKTSGVGIVKFAVYDKNRSLRFFHNHVNHKPQSAGDAPTDSRFGFPPINDASQLCLTTSNSHGTQQYALTITGKPQRKSKSSLTPRRRTVNPVVSLKPKPPADLPPVIPPMPPIVPIAATSVTVELPPNGTPYCYVGTWQAADLSKYWLPTLQNFTQAQIVDPQMLGSAKIILTRDGNATFDAIDLEQKYTLTSKETGAKVDRIGINLTGNSTAKFQTNQDGILVFNAQDYRGLTARLNLGDNLKLTGDRLFTPFGDPALPTVSSAYNCLDRDNLILKVPSPNREKSIPVSLRRVN